jgi:TRAP-type C4-dicarboxylate transport system permease small subunit
MPARDRSLSGEGREILPEKWMNILDRLERFITAATAVIMIILSVLICWQVFSRYVLNSSPFWIEELSVISLMWIGLLGAAACVWTESHMSLELVVSRLPETVRIWLRAATDIAIGGFALFLCERGIFLVQRTMSGTLSSLPLAVGYTYLILPIAGGLMLLFAGVRAVTGVTRFYAERRGRRNG